MTKSKTWGDIYNAAVRRAYDHGYAAWLADQWEKRRNRNGQNGLTDSDIDSADAAGILRSQRLVRRRTVSETQ